MEKVVVLYTRISRADRQAGESVSIGAQRALLREYVAADPVLSTFSVVEICDDGVSGVSFERPGMCRLLGMVKCGEVACVLVKDLSRFGREYVEAGYWMEQVFPAAGVQMVSVGEGLDTAIKGRELDAAVQNMVHTLYSRDLSRKVSSARRIRMEQGAFTSPAAIFGYRKSAAQSHRLEILPETAAVVRHIFALACAGNGAAEIARMLNRSATPTPLAFRRRAQDREKPNNVWTRDAVCRILRDERYTGSMVAGKRRRVRFSQTEAIPHEAWVRVENTHDGIVTQEMFAQAQHAMATLRTGNSGKRNRNMLLRCAHCGHTLRRKSTATPYYFCDTGSFTSCACSVLRIEQAQVERVMDAAVSCCLQAARSDEWTQPLLEKIGIDRAATQKAAAQKKQRDAQAAIQQKARLYERWKNGDLTREEYQAACSEPSTEPVSQPDDSAHGDAWVQTLQTGHCDPVVLAVLRALLVQSAKVTKEGEITLRLGCASPFAGDAARQKMDEVKMQK